MTVNITVIGGGSSMFVPALVRRLIEIPSLRGGQLTLMDVDGARLKVMEVLARRLVEAEGVDLAVQATQQQRASLVGADFVVTAISVGGMSAWESDIEVPGKYGVFMHIADSVGPGGIMRALRNVPVLTSVCRDVAEVAPSAWVLNYTNPASVNAMAMATIGEVKSASLCSCSGMPIDPEWLGEQTGLQPGEVVVPLRVGGINHCTGIFELTLRDGSDALPLVRERATEPVVQWVLDTFGVLPYCWTHWVEFFPQLQRLEESYQGRSQGLKMRYGRAVYDMNQQRGRVRGWENLAEEWVGRSTSKLSLKDLPHGPEDDGIFVAEIMDSIIEDKRKIFVVNIANHGLVGNLRSSAVVEVPAIAGAAGLTGVPIGKLPRGLAAVLDRHVAVQELTLEAALGGSLQALREAFSVEPLLDAVLEPKQIDGLMSEMLEVNAQYLPMFA